MVFDPSPRLPLGKILTEVKLKIWLRDDESATSSYSPMAACPNAPPSPACGDKVNLAVSAAFLFEKLSAALQRPNRFYL